MKTAFFHLRSREKVSGGCKKVLLENNFTGTGIVEQSFFYTLRIPGLNDQTIYLFDDQQTAEAFMFEKLVESGNISIDDGKLLVGNRACDTKEEAVDEVQFQLGIIEFFHVYKAIDERSRSNESKNRRTVQRETTASSRSPEQEASR